MLSEVCLAQVSDHGGNESRENAVLVNSTAFHLAVLLDLDKFARVLLPQVGAILSFASGPKPRARTPLHIASELG